MACSSLLAQVVTFLFVEVLLLPCLRIDEQGDSQFPVTVLVLSSIYSYGWCCGNPVVRGMLKDQNSSAFVCYIIS